VVSLTQTAQLSVLATMMSGMAPETTLHRPLVGRADELGRLAELVGLDRPADGHGSGGATSHAVGAVLLAGDAGVGKTRLLAELRDHAIGAGWRVIVGHCLDFGDTALPYLPFSEAFGRLAVESPGLASSLVEAAPAVARLMPQRRMLSGSDGGGTTGRVDVGGEPGDQTGDSRIDRSELFEAVHAALERLAQSAPLLILVEDAHWADQSTRELLSFLFSRRFSEPIAIVTSYRSDDMHRRHPLRTTIAEWGRLPGVTRLLLRPLGEADVRELVRVLHPAPLAEAELRRIVERSEGNAFFTEELVAAAELGSRLLPTDLADLLLVRLDQLDDATRLVVRAAAVAGRRVPHELLASVVDLDPLSLERAMRSAVESNVLVPVGVDGYAFRHALLAEAVYDDLLPGERVRVHGAYVTALVSGDVPGTAAELARHARAAHDPATAAQASIQAGDEAMTVAGPDEAARHYEVALELLADRKLAAAAEVDVIALTVKASSAATNAGHVLRALALVQDQLTALPADAPPLDRGRLLLALAEAALLSDSNVDVLAVTTEALHLVPAEPLTSLRARVVNIYARANSDRRRDDEASRALSKAIALARDLGLADVLADATTTLARIEERAGDPDSSRAVLEATVSEARAAGEVAAELRGLFSIGGIAYERGRLDEALAGYAAAAARARETGRPWAPYGVDSRIMVAIVAHVAGDWELVERTVDVSSESPPGMSEAALAAAGLAVAAGRGQRSAIDLLPSLRPWWERDGMIGVITGAAAIDLFADAGDLDAATAIYDDVVATVAAVWDQPWFQARVRLSALMLGQLGAEAARSGSAERSALAARGDEFAAAAQEVAEQGHHGREQGPEGLAWAARVRAEHLRLRWLTGVSAPPEEELVEAWQAAVSAFESFGHVFEVARSRARLAAVLKAVGRPAEAAEQVAAAREVAVSLRAEPLLAELRVLGGPGGGAAMSRASGSSRGPVSRRDEPLTGREKEVLALVAEGRSNREIGQQLYISAKTVSVHVSNILAKLGAAGRTEAVALARRRGLLNDETS
jgi:DNA-binding CsgD family transcriptional regulator/tetratricopeptide (TPR) repeat protein